MAERAATAVRTPLRGVVATERRVYNDTVVPVRNARRGTSKTLATESSLLRESLAVPKDSPSSSRCSVSSALPAITLSPDSVQWSLGQDSMHSGREPTASLTSIYFDAVLGSSVSMGGSSYHSVHSAATSATASVQDLDVVGEVDSVDGMVKAVVDVPVNLAFRNVTYTAWRRIRFRRVTRRILDGVSGEFRAGQLSSIMGPSGAGKSSLMGVLTGYTPRGVTGQLLVNGSPRHSSHFRRQSVYIPQDAPLFPQLTVKEALNVAAHLKLGSTGPEAQRTIGEVLESLGLSEHQSTLTGRLSGGQLKRLAIAMEILNNPPVMFFDEPTSGLDSSSTRQCVSLLRRLAREGRTVICTIHQPSASVFALLDQLYLLVGGRCAYRGDTANLVTYLGRLGLHCPPYHNPADYALEVTSGDYGDHSAKLVQASSNGASGDWTSRQGEPQTYMLEPPRLQPSPEPSTVSGSFRASRTTCTAPRSYPTAFWMQVYVLIKRSLLRALRDPMLCHSRLYTHLLMGFLISMFFLNIGGDAAHVFDNYSLLFFCLMFLMFTAFSATSLTFPLEMPVLARERFNRWYSLKAYFLAVSVADMPVQGTCTVVYSILVYFLTSQPPDADRFFQFVLICALVAYVSQSIGFIIGAGLQVQHGVIFGPLAILPFTVFSGYFVYQKDAPAGLRWLFHGSFLKYGLEGVMVAVYGADRAKLDCSEAYCHFRVPDKFLSELEIHDGCFWLDVVVLAGLGTALRVVAYFVLKYRLKLFL